MSLLDVFAEAWRIVRRNRLERADKAERAAIANQKRMTTFKEWFKALYIQRGFVSSEKELAEAFEAGAQATREERASQIALRESVESARDSIVDQISTCLAQQKDAAIRSAINRFFRGAPWLIEDLNGRCICIIHKDGREELQIDGTPVIEFMPVNTDLNSRSLTRTLKYRYLVPPVTSPTLAEPSLEKTPPPPPA
jgi:hypothetical protein